MGLADEMGLRDRRFLVEVDDKLQAAWRRALWRASALWRTAPAPQERTTQNLPLLCPAASPVSWNRSPGADSAPPPGSSSATGRAAAQRALAAGGARFSVPAASAVAPRGAELGVPLIT